MSMSIALALSAGLATVPSHSIEVVHRDTPYAVAYRAVSDTQLKTIGTSLPNRASTEKCVRTTKIWIERHITAAAEAQPLTSRLPETHSWRDYVTGSCRHATDDFARIDRKRAGEVDRMLAATATADRPAALAAIDAAHALATR